MSLAILSLYVLKSGFKQCQKNVNTTENPTSNNTSPDALMVITGFILMIRKCTGIFVRFAAERSRLKKMYLIHANPTGTKTYKYRMKANDL